MGDLSVLSVASIGVWKCVESNLAGKLDKLWLVAVIGSVVVVLRVF